MKRLYAGLYESLVRLLHLGLEKLYTEDSVKNTIIYKETDISFEALCSMLKAQAHDCIFAKNPGKAWHRKPVKSWLLVKMENWPPRQVFWGISLYVKSKFVMIGHSAAEGRFYHCSEYGSADRELFASRIPIWILLPFCIQVKKFLSETFQKTINFTTIIHTVFSAISFKSIKTLKETKMY